MVCDPNEFRRVTGLLEMLVPRVAVAEVIAEFHAVRNPVAQAYQALVDFALGFAKERRHDAFEHREFDCGVPLDRKVPVRDRGKDFVEFLEHLRFVRPVQGRHALGEHVGMQRRERSRQADLEAEVRADHAFVPQAPEHRI